MPTILAGGGAAAAPDAAASSANTAQHFSPAHGSSVNNNNNNNNNNRPPPQKITPAATAVVPRRGYSNCNRLRLLALLAGASVILALWEQTYGILGRTHRREGPEVHSRGRGHRLDTRRLALTNNEPRKPRVAVCFFGMVRSLRWTLPSIQSRLLGVLKEGGMEVETFVHTYDMREVNNERAKEMHIKYEGYVDDYLRLEPVRSLVTNQDDFDLLWPDPLSLTHYNWHYPKNLAHSIIRNVFRAYWSMATVLSLMELYSLEKGFQYDAVILARPDVWFHVDTDLPRRTFPLPARTVFIPSFYTDVRRGEKKNDRFAYGSLTAMKVLMSRIETLLDPDVGRLPEISESERVLGYHLQKHNISVTCLDFPISRVRMTGEIAGPDRVYVGKACKSGNDPMACEMIKLDFKIPTMG